MEPGLLSGTGFMKGLGMYRSGALSTRRKDDPDGAPIPPIFGIQEPKTLYFR